MSEGPQPTPAERREAIERATHTLLRAAERVRERTRLLVEIPRVSMTGSFHAADEDAAAWLAPFAENAVPRHDARVVLRFVSSIYGIPTTLFIVLSCNGDPLKAVTFTLASRDTRCSPQ